MKSSDAWYRYANILRKLGEDDLVSIDPASNIHDELVFTGTAEDSQHIVTVAWLVAHAGSFASMKGNDRDDPSIVIAALNLDREDDALSSAPFTENEYRACLLVLGAPAPARQDDDIVARAEWCERLYDWCKDNMDMDGKAFIDFSKAYDRWWSIEKEKQL